MCYSDEDRPPEAPGTHTPAHGEDFVLTSRDGNQFSAYVAWPSAPTGATVVIYPDVRGLHHFYKALAMRFAEVGITALAIDYFGRTAGLTARDDAFEFWPHVQQIQFDSFKLDVQSALDYLHEKVGADAPIFVIGFCMGGSFTFLSSTVPEFGFAGVMPFYAGLSRAFGGQGTVLDVADRVRYPVLGLFGGADEGIPEVQRQELDNKLDTAKIEHTIYAYPGAPHSFFDRKATDFAEASTDAWNRVLAFIQSHTPHVHHN
jgi:carboxymethylenebutenolidase